MTSLSSKTLLATLIAVGLMFSASAKAGIVLDSNSAPVLTNEGNCVITDWTGTTAECDAAKAAAGIAAPTATVNAPTAVNTDWHKMPHDHVVFFDFNKSSLTPHAKKHLDHIAQHLKDSKHENKSITIVGYSDRLGNAAYNEKLAKKRAETVRAYLLSQGVKAKKIEVRSLGKTVPTAECSADLPHAKLVSCLREDRRVEIEVGDASK